MPAAKQRNQAGFSLVETVAAMGVLAIAALPIMQVASNATNNAARLEARLLARMVAENELSYVMSDPNPVNGGLTSGISRQLARSFEWTLVASPAISGDVQTLELSVRREGDPQVLAKLVSLKAVPVPVQIADTSSQSEWPASDPGNESETDDEDAGG
ncbi:MAG: type II secretion system minor pseudopilin GspI [Pseudomonadota bacterium]